MLIQTRREMGVSRARTSAKDIKNNNPDQTMIKCLHDDSTAKIPSAFILHSSMKGLKNSTVEDTVRQAASSH